MMSSRAFLVLSKLLIRWRIQEFLKDDLGGYLGNAEDVRPLFDIYLVFARP